MKKHFVKGYKSAITGSNSGQNPHKKNTKRFSQWDDGWISGFIDLTLHESYGERLRRRIPKNRKMR